MGFVIRASFSKSEEEYNSVENNWDNDEHFPRNSNESGKCPRVSVR
jgi:hypothetical protein